MAMEVWEMQKEEGPPMTDAAKRCAEEIFRDLGGRQGFDSLLHNCEPDVATNMIQAQIDIM